MSLEIGKQETQDLLRCERQESILSKGDACTFSAMRDCMKIHVLDVGVGGTCTGLTTASKR